MPGELRQMRAVDAIVQTVVSSPDDIAYISGSLIEGFGNSSSDIDLFLITAADPAYNGPFGTALGDYYLDLEIFTRDGMRVLTERLNTLDPSDFRAVWLTPLADLDLYYRTLIGEACHNAPGFSAMHAAFRREVAERLLAAWCGLRYAASMQHAREELDTGRAVSAAIAAQAASASALDAYLAAHGEAFPSLKWRQEKLARLHGKDSGLYRRAWSLKAPGQREVSAYMGDVAAFGAELGMEAYAGWTLEEVPLVTNGAAMSRDVGEDAYILQNQRYLFEVSREVREVFDHVAAGPRTRAEIAGSLNIGESQVRESIAALQGHALVRAY
ncbi:MAG TPA: hypothetical protein VFS30_17665 [Dehalococcoidia bacterium]|nr:hypothetical protein [Dehalococcoidia bacterium]